MKAANVLRTCQKKNSGFANFSNSDQWCFAHGLSIGKMPRSTGENSNWNGWFAKFRNSDHTKNNWPNHEINGNSGSPKLLIQANNGQKSKLVSFWSSLHSEWSVRRKFHGDKYVYDFYLQEYLFYIKLKFGYLWYYLYLKEYIPSCGNKLMYRKIVYDLSCYIIFN